MERSLLFRRIFHMTAPAYLVYYLLPDYVEGVDKRYGVLVVVAAMLLIEGVRLSKRSVFFGLRDYEKNRISAFAWASLGMMLALLLFPMHLVVIAFLGLAFIDPLIGELRRLGHDSTCYPLVPLVAYFCMAFFYLGAGAWYPIHAAAILAGVGAVVTIAAEYPNLEWINDDFTIVIVPLIVLYPIWLWLV